MNPLRLRASAFRSYPELDLTFPEGCVAIVGPNGSGKSSLIAALDVALFGSRSMGDYLSDDGDGETMFVELTFEHVGETYRVRRTFSAKGRGKSTTDFERLLPDPDVRIGFDFPPDAVVTSWEPLTAETQSATQEAIEEILGLSRETLHASALLMQGQGGVWTEAKPAERKAVLSEILGLSSWDRFLEAARTDRRSAERSLAETDGRIALLAERGGDVAVLAEAKLRAEEVVADREIAHGVLEGELTTAAENVTALERLAASYLAATSQVAATKARLAERQGVVDRATQAKAEAVQVQAELDRIGDPSIEVAGIETKLAESRARAERRREAEVERDKFLAEAREARMQADRLADECEAVQRAYEEASRKAAELNRAGVEHSCDRCGQAIHGEAYERTLMQIREERDEAQRRVAGYTERIAGLVEAESARAGFAAQVEIPDAPRDEEVVWLEQGLRSARQAELTVAEARERLRLLEATIAELTPEVLAELELLNAAHADAQAALAAIDEPEPGAVDAARVAAVTAKAQLDIAANALREARENLIRAQAALEQAQAAAQELAAARERRSELADEIEILTTLERAYGRDGIPALIVEASAIPQIEAEANRILVELGTAYRVELRTQRELKSGDGLADTLDVVVIAEAGERDYSTFSGGERSRLDVALRLALASLLANRRGAESKVLVLDEVSFLDEAGQAALVNVLLGLRDRFSKQVIVSHHSGLRDAPLDAILQVVKEDGRSRVEVAA